MTVRPSASPATTTIRDALECLALFTEHGDHEEPFDPECAVRFPRSVSVRLAHSPARGAA